MSRRSMLGEFNARVDKSARKPGRSMGIRVAGFQRQAFGKGGKQPPNPNKNAGLLYNQARGVREQTDTDYVRVQDRSSDQRTYLMEALAEMAGLLRQGAKIAGPFKDTVAKLLALPNGREGLKKIARRERYNLSDPTQWHLTQAYNAAV